MRIAGIEIDKLAIGERDDTIRRHMARADSLQSEQLHTSVDIAHAPGHMIDAGAAARTLLQQLSKPRGNGLYEFEFRSPDGNECKQGLGVCVLRLATNGLRIDAVNGAECRNGLVQVTDDMANMLQADDIVFESFL